MAVHGFPFVDLAVLGAAVLGALILTQDGRHPIGLVLLLVGFTGAVSLLAEAYSIWVIDEDGPGSRSLAGWSGWVSSLLGGQLSIAALALMFLLAPDGRLLSRRWRWAAATTVLGALLCAASVLIQHPGDLRPQRQDRPRRTARGSPDLGRLPADQRRVARVGRLDGAQAAPEPRRDPPAGAPDRTRGGPRRRRSREPVRGADRQRRRADLGRQPAPVRRLRAPASGSSGSPCSATGCTTSRSSSTAPSSLGDRHCVRRGRLHHPGGRRRRPGRRHSGGVWVSLLATAMVAVAFQPLRRQVIRLANRLAYGSRAQPYEALSDFSRRLAETPDPRDAATGRRRRSAGSAVSARGAAAVLDDLGRPGALGELGHLRQPTQMPTRSPSGTAGTTSAASGSGSGRGAAAPVRRAPARRRSPTRPRSCSATSVSRPSSRPGRRAGPHDGGAGPVPAPDHRGRRRGTTGDGGRHLPRRAAAPRDRSGRDHGREESGRRRAPRHRARRAWSPAPTPRWRRCVT